MRVENSGPRLACGRWRHEVVDATWPGRSRIKANQIGAGWGSLVGEYEWERFATLTMDPKRFRHVNEATVSREVFAWCNNVAWLARRPVGWAYVVEGGGGRHLHAHVLLVGTREESWNAACAAWAARNGKILAETVSDRKGVASYLCKTVGLKGEIVLADTLNRYPRSVLKIVDAANLKST